VLMTGAFSPARHAPARARRTRTAVYGSGRARPQRRHAALDTAHRRQGAQLVEEGDNSGPRMRSKNAWGCPAMHFPRTCVCSCRDPGTLTTAHGAANGLRRMQLWGATLAFCSRQRCSADWRPPGLGARCASAHITHCLESRSIEVRLQRHMLI
jgi:hypothetical protein